MRRASLKLNLRSICIVFLSILIIACVGLWAYRGRFIEIILTVSAEEELFDVDFKIPTKYKEVLPGENISVRLTFYNIERTERVDVDFEYGIEDTEDNEIVSERTIVSVDAEGSVLKSLVVPFDIKPGNYVFFAKVRYDDIAGTSSYLFRVIAKEELGMGRVTLFSLIVITFVLIIVMIILCLYKRDGNIPKTVKHLNPI